MNNKIDKLLSENPYPGRGIILGKTPDGGYAVSAYFIMGRSENSRNRVFTEKRGSCHLSLRPNQGQRPLPYYLFPRKAI